MMKLEGALYPWRFRLMLGLLALMVGAIAWRIIDLQVVDRDFLELNNLQRQVLFDEEDVAAGIPKAIAAANKLAKINSQITIEPLVTDVEPANVLELAADVNVILDGTDNFETRMLLNDVAHQQRIPWVYGGCLGAEGQQFVTSGPSASAHRSGSISVPPTR